MPKLTIKKNMGKLCSLFSTSFAKGILRHTLLCAVFLFSSTAFADDYLTEGYYNIVSAGYGTGYYTETTVPPIRYNQENLYALYNDGDQVKWKTYDPTSFDQIYHFTPDGNGNWYVQSLLYSTYIDRGKQIYGAGVSTSSTPTTPQTFTLIDPTKYVIQFSGNPYVYALSDSHNGARDAEGDLSIWGTPSEAKKYGVNVWYVHRVSEAVIDSFRKALVSDIEDGYYAIVNNNDAYAAVYGNKPALYTARATTTNDALALCRYDTYSPTNANYIFYISHTGNGDRYTIKNAYSGWYLNFHNNSGNAMAGNDAGDGNSSASNHALTCSPTPRCSQIIRWKGVNHYWICSDADTTMSHAIASENLTDKNGIIIGGDSYNASTSSQQQSNNSWALVPVSADEVSSIIEAQRSADYLKQQAYKEMTDYHDSISAQYETIVRNENNQYNQNAVISLKDKQNTVESLINSGSYDITSTAADYTTATANLRRALNIALTAKPDTTSNSLLSGIPIGATSVDYSTGQPSTTVNTPADVFDEDYSTYYSSYDRSTGWVGLDLGSQYVIHKVAYAPRANFSQRLVLGVFEGANKPDFSDAIPFHVIKDAPDYNTLTTDDVHCSRGFRYVRYVGPNDSRTNISELRFYGTAGSGDDSHLFQLTNLPLVVIRTTANVAEVTSRSTYLPGHINIISQDGSNIMSDSMKVRGRGNGSWSFEKKPYKFKLENKSRLLDMPAKAKEWVLINNYGDKSLIRNNVAFTLSRIFQMDFTPAISLVDVIFNGQYKGSYQLCDQVEVRKNRVDITKMDADDNAGDSLTGGYLIEIDAYAGSEPKHFSSYPYSIPVTVHYPKDDEITDEQFSYIQQTFDDLCQRVYSEAYKDSVEGYSAVLDQETWLKYFLIEELSGNTDGYYSVFMTKDRGQKFRVSPVWDFDLAFDNDRRTHPILTMNEFLSLSSRSSSATGAKSFNRKIINSCTNELKDLWSWYRYKSNLNYEYLKAVIDSLGEENSLSAQYNYTRWDILNTPTQQQYTTRGSYKAEVDFLSEYLFDRLAWMDNKVGLEEPIGVHSTSDTQIRGGIHAHEGYVLIRGFAEGSVAEVYSLSGVRIGPKIVISEFDNKVSLPKGVFIVRVTDTNGRTTTQKVAIE